MSNYALVEDYVARNYNLKVFAKYLRESGLSQIAETFEKNVNAQENLNVLGNLDFLSSDNSLKQSHPDVVKIANYIYAEPKSLMSLYPELKLIASKSLKDYGFYLDYIHCPAIPSLNFNDLGHFEHAVWTHRATNDITDQTFGRVFINYSAPKNFVSSLEELENATTEIQTIFERDANSIIGGNTNYAYCALCGLTKNAISTVQIPNRIEDVSQYLNSWVLDAMNSRQEWTVLASLRPPIIESY